MTNNAKQEELPVEVRSIIFDAAKVGLHVEEAEWFEMKKGIRTVIDAHAWALQYYINRQIVQALERVRAKSGWIDEDRIFNPELDVSDPLTGYVPLAELDNLIKEYKEE